MKQNNSFNQTRIISGYAVKWNSWSQLITEKGKEFYEQIERGSFKQSLGEKYQVSCYEHDLSKEIASVDAGTLILKEDSVGLFYKIYLPDNQLGKQICSEIDDGLLSRVSVGFKDADYTWVTIAGVKYGSIRKANLYEISLVKTPAYKDTTIVDRGALSSTMLVTQIDKVLLEQRKKEVLRKIKESLAL